VQAHLDESAMCSSHCLSQLSLNASSLDGPR
jgi:hypothetical protein